MAVGYDQLKGCLSFQLICAKFIHRCANCPVQLTFRFLQAFLDLFLNYMI